MSHHKPASRATEERRRRRGEARKSLHLAARQFRDLWNRAGQDERMIIGDAFAAKVDEIDVDLSKGDQG